LVFAGFSWNLTPANSEGRLYLFTLHNVHYSATLRILDIELK
jgi:hypothetical protein